MFGNLQSSNKNTKDGAATSRKRDRGRSRSSASYAYDILEERRLLAFVSAFDGTTLTLDQVADDGVTIVDNDGPGNAFRVTDLSGTDTFEAAENVVINLLDGINPFSLELNTAHDGNVEINAGNGFRAINLTGHDNRIGGNLTITSGDGAQFIGISQVNFLEVAGDVDIDAGAGNDSSTALDPIRIGGDFNLTGIQEFRLDSGLMEVVGSVSVDNSSEDLFANFDTPGGAMSDIGGDFNYIGSSQNVDHIYLTEFLIGGDINVDFGDGFTGGMDSQQLRVETVEFENLSVTGGDSTNYDIVTTVGADIGGDITINLGPAHNAVNLQGSVGAGTTSYVGTTGHDVFIYNLSGSGGQSVAADLGGHIDVFRLLDGSSIDYLEINFGDGDDEFINGHGQFTFDAQLQSLVRFHHEYDLATDTLTSTEMTGPAVSDLHIIKEATGEFVTEGNTITPATNLVVQKYDFSPFNLTVSLDSILDGDLTINLGSGDGTFDLDGAVNAVVGDVAITGGTGAQGITLHGPKGLAVGGNLTIDVGIGEDIIDTITEGAVVGGNLSMYGVNGLINDGALGSVGNFIFDVSMETQETVFANLKKFEVHGNALFFGGPGKEHISFSAGEATIAGDFYANLGEETTGAFQALSINAHTFIDGNFTLISANNLTGDFFVSQSGSQINGNTYVNLGDGSNNASFFHTNGGDLIKYVGGTGGDEVDLKAVGEAYDANIVLGAANDRLALFAEANIDNKLRVDFGGGGDVFDNAAGAFTFNASLLNFNDSSCYYKFATDSLTIVQLADLGGSTVDDSGVGGAIRYVQGFAGIELTPAANVRVNLVPGGSELTVDFANPLTGDLILSLKDGARDVFFKSTANDILGNLRIEAGNGNQHIHLAQEAPLTVNGNVRVNLRQGNDRVIDNGNEITVLNHLTLRNVNDFKVTNALGVGGKMKMATVWETQKSRLKNLGQIQVGSYLTYLGGAGEDDVLLDGDVFIGDRALIDVGSNVFAELQKVSLTSTFQAADDLRVRGGNSVGGNRLVTDASITVGEDMIVDFGGSNTDNTAVLLGHYGGQHGSYRGGSGSDHVTFGAWALDMAFGTLLRGGDDYFVLTPEADVDSLFVNFGAGEDIFEDDHVEEFPMDVRNLP